MYKCSHKETRAKCSKKESLGGVESATQIARSRHITRCNGGMPSDQFWLGGLLLPFAPSCSSSRFPERLSFIKDSHQKLAFLSHPAAAEKNGRNFKNGPGFPGFSGRKRESCAELRSTFLGVQLVTLIPCSGFSRRNGWPAVIRL